jgi:hypothetical protein
VAEGYPFEVEIEIHFQNQKDAFLNVAGLYCHVARGR